MKIAALPVCPLLLTPALAQDDDAPKRPAFISHEEGHPHRERGAQVHADGASDGYLLIAPINARKTYLLDMNGSVKHMWKNDSSPGRVFEVNPGVQDVLGE